MRKLHALILTITVILACSCKDRKASSIPKANDTTTANAVTVELPVIDLQKEW